MNCVIWFFCIKRYQEMQLSMLLILRKSVSSWKRNPSICAAAQQPHTPLTDHYHVTRY